MSKKGISVQEDYTLLTVHPFTMDGGRTTLLRKL